MAESRDSKPRKEPPAGLTAKIHAWLEDVGFPFELQAGRTLRAAGWQVDHGVTYEDPSTGTTRELDLRARYKHGDKRGVITVTLAIECKTSRNRPWVVFTSEPSTVDFIEYLRIPGSLAAHAVMGAEAPLSLFPPVARVGHAATTALRDKKASHGDSSGPYATGRAALSAAVALAHASERFVEKYAPERGLVEIVVPTVIVDTPLYEFYVDDDGREVLQPINSVLLGVPEPLRGDQVTYVLIVHREVLPAMSSDWLEGAEELARKCLPDAARLVKEHMDHVEGARHRRGDTSVPDVR